MMKRQAAAVIPTPWGNFNMIAFSNTEEEQMPHLAMVHEDMDAAHPVLVRIHSECLTGDLFGSKRCDCGEQLDQAMQMCAEEGGIVVYMRQEGRNIGLINKLKAYKLQDTGLNTADANTHLGLEVDGRQYDEAIQILEALVVNKIRLITNNPLKLDAIKDSSIQLVERVPIIIAPQKQNKGYLQTKEELMGHLFDSQGKK